MSLDHCQNEAYKPLIYNIPTSNPPISLLLESSTTLAFPSGSGHLINNLSNYMPFRLASYGQKFLRLLVAEHPSILYRTGLPVDTILLSSLDPNGGYDTRNSTDSHCCGRSRGTSCYGIM